MGAPTSVSMRSLRALASLVLALALLVGALAPSRPAGLPPAGFEAAATSGHGGHGDMSAAVEHVATEGPGKAEGAGHPVHSQNACRTMCCIAPAQMPSPTPDIGTVGFYCTILYVDRPRSGTGRAFAPDPGVPKLTA